MNIQRSVALLALLFVLGCGGGAPVDPSTVAPDPQFVVPSGGSSSNAQIATGGSETRVEPAVVYDHPDAKAETTINIYVVFDGSGSMNERPAERSSGGKSFGTKLEGAKWATEEFVGKVPDNVNLGLFVFDAKGVREVVPLGPKNRDAFLAAVRAVNANGGTPLGESITEGVRKLHEQRKKQLGYGEFRLVVVTDGIANDQNTFAKGISNSLAAQIPLYSIGFCVGADHPLKKHSFSYTAADSAEALAKGLEQVLVETDSVD